MAVKVLKNKENPETTLILAESIVKISDAFDALYKSGLNKEAIMVLIQDQTRISRRDIRSILDSLKTLKGYYCR